MSTDPADRATIVAVMLNHDSYIKPGRLVCTCGWEKPGAGIGSLAAAGEWYNHVAGLILAALETTGWEHPT